MIIYLSAVIIHPNFQINFLVQLAMRYYQRFLCANVLFYDYVSI